MEGIKPWKNRAKENKIKDKREKKKRKKKNSGDITQLTINPKCHVALSCGSLKEPLLSYHPRGAVVCSGWEKWRNKIVPPTCTRHPPCTHKNILRVGVRYIYTIRVYVHFSLEGATVEGVARSERERERRIGGLGRTEFRVTKVISFFVRKVSLYGSEG